MVPYYTVSPQRWPPAGFEMKPKNLHHALNSDSRGISHLAKGERVSRVLPHVGKKINVALTSTLRRWSWAVRRDCQLQGCNNIEGIGKSLILEIGSTPQRVNTTTVAMLHTIGRPIMTGHDNIQTWENSCRS